MYQCLLKVLEDHKTLLEALFSYLVQNHPEDYKDSVEKMRQQIQKVTLQDGGKIVCEVQEDKK